VLELQQLGLYDSVRAAGAHHVARHWGCDEGVAPEEAIAGAMEMRDVVPGVSGPLCIGHPALCQHFIDLAAASGATVLRGIDDPRVELGRVPEVSYLRQGERHVARGRLVVGADGRGSQVRRQLGIELHRDPPHHLFAGMLIEGAHGWPADTQVIGSEGDVHYLAFPQGGGRVRLYLGYSADQPRRLAGAGGPQAFLDAFRLTSVPGSEHLAGAMPAGPCNSFSNEDSWASAIVRPGALLLGDAAGANDPIIGQGLSITLRDVRLVRDLLLDGNGGEWTEAHFAPYAEERTERMRRLRFSASIAAALANEFGDAARERRRRARERQAEDPMLFLPLLAAFLGPHNVPPEVFEEATRERLLAP
jgi:2-polyprenyl-6-methoxyphenol hydroxylase-like FAD-dependent oxidoreductase